jgi:hypothetical protein
MEMQMEKRVLLGIVALTIGLTVAVPAAAEEIVVAERDGVPVLVHVAEEPIDISEVGLLPVLFDTDNPIIARVLSFGGLDRSIEEAAARLTNRQPQALAQLDTRGSAPATVLLAP